MRGTAHGITRVKDIFDKGKAALVVRETECRDDTSGRVLVISRSSSFIRGEGGFGGDPGPPAGNLPPDRAPDQVVEMPVMPQQALIYRLSGDKNPLHADPAFAARGGFDSPSCTGCAPTAWRARRWWTTCSLLGLMEWRHSNPPVSGSISQADAAFTFSKRRSCSNRVSLTCAKLRLELSA